VQSQSEKTPIPLQSIPTASALRNEAGAIEQEQPPAPKEREDIHTIPPQQYTTAVTPQREDRQDVPPPKTTAPDSVVPWTSGANNSPDITPAGSGVLSKIGNDLETPEITAGLEDLLSEWKIFRSSGMFGTGAGGREHPLYKKLAPMPMSIVARGTWEGAKKEEILSVRDYVNGWLHEQAVMYMPTETFEHYLRRVVKKVLERQLS